MPFDAVFLTAVTKELGEKAVGARVERVHQPTRDTILVHLRSREGAQKLFISAGSSAPRVHFTRESVENPQKPPMFCMLLRKHLSGARIVDITQPPMERILELHLECLNEMGERSNRKLIVELMGRNSNLILLDVDGRITECLRRVDFEMSEERQVLPGLFYAYPPTQNRQDPTKLDETQLLALLTQADGNAQLAKWLMEQFTGLSPLICREFSYELCGAVDGILANMDLSAVASLLFQEWDKVRNGTFVPTLLVGDGKPKDYTYGKISQYASSVELKEMDSFSQLLDSFYASKDRSERMRQKGQTIQRTVSNLRDRTTRKLEIQQKELTATYDRERLRQLGDIVMANLHLIPRGASTALLENFYDENMGQITVPLSPQLSPQQNAAKFYKRYTKAKNAEKMLTELMGKGAVEKEYFSSVLDTISRCETEKDLMEVRGELIDGGYIKETDRKKKMKQQPSKPMEFLSTEGFTILVGRNNRQNDLLTLKMADKRDLWLHTQKIHGSHAIVLTQGREVGDQTVTEAATLAAYYSQAREGQNVPVDFTMVRNVKKPSGAKPGMVVYDPYRTAFVTPSEELCQQLRQGK